MATRAIAHQGAQTSLFSSTPEKRSDRTAIPAAQAAIEATRTSQNTTSRLINRVQSTPVTYQKQEAQAKSVKWIGVAILITAVATGILCFAPPVALLAGAGTLAAYGALAGTAAIAGLGIGLTAKGDQMSPHRMLDFTQSQLEKKPIDELLNLKIRATIIIEQLRGSPGQSIKTDFDTLFENIDNALRKKIGDMKLTEIEQLDKRIRPKAEGFDRQLLDMYPNRSQSNSFLDTPQQTRIKSDVYQGFLKEITTTKIAKGGHNLNQYPHLSSPVLQAARKIEDPNRRNMIRSFR